MIGFFGELYEYRSMITNLVKRDIRGRYKGSLLGFMWNFVIPLMQIIVYIMVFTIVFKQDIQNYYVYLIVGMVPWYMFSDSISSGSGSVIDNSQLITKIYFPRSVIPISIVLSKFVNFVISMGIIFFVLIVGGHGMEVYALLCTPLAIFCLFLFSLGLALFLAAANVYMRDVQYMISVILMMWIWLTPIMYVQGFVDNDLFQTILAINPMTYIIGMFQDCLYWKVVPTLESSLVCIAESFAMLFIGIITYNKLSPDFAEVL